MNKHWHSFLESSSGVIAPSGAVVFPHGDNFSDRVVYPLTHFGVLTVSGKDAATLLQGQITCNVNDINMEKSSLAAMCNPKGRVIAIFLLVKKADDFLLVLPVELVDTVRKKLQMYVLRSDVKITDSSDSYCLLGMFDTAKHSQPFFTESNNDVIAVDLPYIVSRKLLIADVESAIKLWSDLVESQGFSLGDTVRWRCLDIYSGIPWLTTETTEEYIPQMLNLDKLGGISFTKGCYTGQEIVARTHYLGKAKREMYLAECDLSELPLPNSVINQSDGSKQYEVGNVLAAQHDQYGCKLLAVLPSSEIWEANLSLRDYNQTPINLSPFNL